MPTRLNIYGQGISTTKKKPCIVATTENIALSGATTPATIDGVSLSIDNRILVWQQNSPQENGIYKLITSQLLARDYDFNINEDLYAGIEVLILSGLTYSGKTFYLTTSGNITIGSSSLSFNVLAGQNGTSGSSGGTGSSGASGSSGTSGTDGTSATSGSSGTSGTDGTSATSGSSGTSGGTGSSGASGSSGSSGTSGATGASGSSGTSGSNAGITSYTNPADNRVITSVSSTAINAESNLVFDGTNLGIGTTSPSQRLEIEDGDILLDGTSNPMLRFGHGTNTTYSSIYRESTTGKLFIRNDQSAGIILDNSNVGIGTTSPGSRLVVKGVTNTSGESALNVTNSSNNSLLFVRNDGNVGIGTTSPASRLHVVGGDAFLGLDWTSANFDGNTPRQFRIASNGNNSGYITQASYHSASTAVTTFFRSYVNAADAGALVFESGAGNFNTNGGIPSSYSERLRITSAGNVGIGTASPTYKLDVSGTGRFADTWGATASNPFLIIERGGSAVSSAIGYDNVNTGMYFGTTTNHKLALRTNNTDVLVLSNTGAATFNSSVEVRSLYISPGGGAGSGSNGIANIQTASSTLGQTSELGLLIKNNGTSGYYSQIGFGYAETKVGAVMGGIITNGGGATASGLFFATRSSTDGSVSPTERMRITSGGSVGIGTASPTNGKLVVKSGESNSTGIVLERGDNTQKLVNIYSETADGKIAIASGANTNIFLNSVGDSYFTGGYNFGIGTTSPSTTLDVVGTITCTTLTETSTIRIKENIEEIQNPLDIVKKLRGVKYNKIGNDNKEIGVIAEEVDNILSEVVVKDNEGQPSSVSYSRLTALLIEAIKEQDNKIEILSNKINELYDRM